MVVWLFVVSAIGSTWQRPPQPILDVLHAPVAPSIFTSPDARYAMLANVVLYPPLEDRAAAMVPLAGLRVDARTNGRHGEYGFVDPRVLNIADGTERKIDVGDAEILDFEWSADGSRVALVLEHPDRLGLWIGTPDGSGSEVEGLALLPLMGEALSWLPDQDRLLVKSVPASRGAPPARHLVPEGPNIREGKGGKAISTYEARDLLTTADDDALFEYYGTSQLAIVDAATGTVENVGAPALYTDVGISPNGDYLLVEHLKGPWSHRHAWYRFASVIEVWTLDGDLVHTVADLPLHDSVPIHGVPEGPRAVSWRATAPATLVWLEALDGGDWSRKVPHRDRMMAHEAPFRRDPVEVFRAEHRIEDWRWAERFVMVEQYERDRRWRHVWKVDVDKRKGEPWFDLSENDDYADPGSPVMRPLTNGRWVLLEVDGHVFFKGAGASPDGDRPFLDRRSLKSDTVERLFRSDPLRFERFIAFLDPKAPTFLIVSESPTDPPNLYRVSLGEPSAASPGESSRKPVATPVTSFPDPTPQLRGVTRRIETYTRDDGTPLSFTLYLPPDYVEGTPLPTVVYAYPLEYSDPGTAGQVHGSEKTFFRLAGSSHLFFALDGYAVLSDTRMPVIGDPDTAYDTFVAQLVADARAAIDHAVALGVTDPNRVGVMGHSHGALMTATLLAHSDLFRAGIARSGAYNHTIRPFGFQSERRTLWEAKDTYLALSPVMFAPQINEPLLLIHGAVDENPGTVPLQSERLFEAVRGTGGTVRWVSLPFEGHGYQARESVEHVLWEQLDWFDKHVKHAEAPAAAQ